MYNIIACRHSVATIRGGPTMATRVTMGIGAVYVDDDARYEASEL